MSSRPQVPWLIHSYVTGKAPVNASTPPLIVSTRSLKMLVCWRSSNPGPFEHILEVWVSMID